MEIRNRLPIRYNNIVVEISFLLGFSSTFVAKKGGREEGGRVCHTFSATSTGGEEEGNRQALECDVKRGGEVSEGATFAGGEGGGETGESSFFPH